MASKQTIRPEQDTFASGSQFSIERLRTFPDQPATLGLAVAAADGLIVLGSGLWAYYLRGRIPGLMSMNTGHLPALRLLGFLLCYTALTVLCNAAGHLYSDAALETARVPKLKVLQGFLLSSLLTVMVVFLANEKSVPRLAFGGTMVFSLIGLIGLRYALQRYNRKRIKRGIGTQHVLIVGAGQIGRAFQEYLDAHSYLGRMFCGFIDDTRRSVPGWLGTSMDLGRILKEQFIDEVYFTPEANRDLILEVALRARDERIGVKVVPDLYEGLALGAGISYIGNVPVLELNRHPIPAFGFFLKRLMDLLIASLLLVLSSPIMLIAAVAIKLGSAGPVFYTAWRVGRKGRKFRCYKLRTMDVGADSKKHHLRVSNERTGATFKIARDPRITRVGSFLRKYSIDEAPQLLNVLRGDMSMVGPRPHPVDDYDQYSLEDLRRLDVLPGITGLWQIRARQDPSFATNVLLDLEYIENWNLSLDIRILFITIAEVLKGSGY